MIAGAVAERLEGLEQRDDVEPADPLLGPEQPRLARQDQHFQQVGRLGGRADDVRAQRLGALLLQDRRGGAERLDDLVRLGRVTAGGPGSAGGSSSSSRDQALEALVGREAERSRRQTPAASEDLVDRLAVCRALCWRRSIVSRWTPKTSTSRIMSWIAPAAAACAPARRRSSAMSVRSSSNPWRPR